MTLDKRAVLVLGMHRSGTSALTRIINLMGFSAPKTLMAATEANEAGFWESEVFMDLDERILKACGHKWSSRKAMAADLVDVAQRRGLTGEVRRAIAEEYGGAPAIVLKDPRISRLMGIYRPVLEEAGYRISPVLALRNPVEVAASVTKRDGFSAAKGLGIWLRYTLDAERATRGQPRTVIAFDELMADWKGTMARAEAQLGAPWPTLSAEGVAEIDGTLKPTLRHHALAPPKSTSWRGFLAARTLDAMTRLIEDPHDKAACRTLDFVSAVFRPF
ncbi:sulfotransferase family protein [Xanthobacter dioxanivorans]|uniref:Sulfotransferase family protein n=1 Tax=Xanthobacter dioxanivorans TaxID=2528964 RepID=A0A974PLF8_9HYPH|nr:sulfotransferase [Xanthobacter dioxanivorans]QRG05341.1 sulfotransferase family protein [Xanthobacter dioxanivorans]